MRQGGTFLLHKNVVDLMFDRLAEKDPDHFAVRQYRKFKLAAGVVSYKRLIYQIW
jgi:type IV secretion system protein VirD4